MAKKSKVPAKLRALLAKRTTSLLWYQRVGRCLNELNQKADYGERFVRELAPRVQLSHPTLYLAMKLEQLYPGRKIEELRELPFGTVRYRLALGEDQEEKRKQLQQQAIKHRWTGHRLRLEMRRLGCTSGPRGGSKRKPGAAAIDLEDLAQRSRSWRRFVQEVWPTDRLSKQSRHGDELAQRIARADQALAKLIACIERRKQPGASP